MSDSRDRESVFRRSAPELFLRIRSKQICTFYDFAEHYYDDFIETMEDMQRYMRDMDRHNYCHLGGASRWRESQIAARISYGRPSLGSLRSNKSMEGHCQR